MTPPTETPLPPPTGPLSIGTVAYHWIDADRADPFIGDESAREVMVQVWYPALSGVPGRRAPYVDDARTLHPLARLMGLPEPSFDDLDRLPTHATSSAPIADAADRYPVLVFSHGRCGFRGHNTVQVEELVSHGYVVAAIDHPYGATGVVFPDGRRVMFDERLLPPWPRERLPGADGAVQSTALSTFVADARFVLDRLADVDCGDVAGPLTGRLDLERLGVFGVSLGAMVMAEAARLDPRTCALLVMDAAMPPDVVAAGLEVPTMWLSRDAATMEREHWDPRDIDDTQRTMREVLDGLPVDGYIVLVPGMFHPDFSDGRLLSPLLAERHITGPVDGSRARTIVNAYSLAFFDRHLRGRAARLLDRAEAFPEVRFERHQGRRAVAIGA